MRIITGKARGMKLDTLDGIETRPTPEVVKEAVFSSLQFDLEGRNMLDLFAGSGQMGLEALSRGCSHCTFVDSSRAALNIILSNAKKTHLYSESTVLCSDWKQYLSSLRGRNKFDIVYLDPPYADKILPDILLSLIKFDALSDIAIVVCEDEVYGIEENAEVAEHFTVKKQARYGRVIITYLEKKNNTKEEEIPQ